VQLHVAHGEPGEEILRYAQARHIDLIAIAWHRTLAAGHAEIVKRLLQTAPCPLLSVRAEAKQEGI
jgi:nucleotide-binding universal stress UspA family protein